MFSRFIHINDTTADFYPGFIATSYNEYWFGVFEFIGDYPMRIKITGYLTFVKLLGNRYMEISEGATLRILLEKLADEIGEEFSSNIYHTQSGLQPNIAILVNGRPFKYLSHGIDNELTEGDAVSVFPPIAGG